MRTLSEKGGIRYPEGRGAAKPKARRDPRLRRVHARLLLARVPESGRHGISREREKHREMNLIFDHVLEWLHGRLAVASRGRRCVLQVGTLLSDESAGTLAQIV